MGARGPQGSAPLLHAPSPPQRTSSSWDSQVLLPGDTSHERRHSDSTGGPQPPPCLGSALVQQRVTTPVPPGVRG